MEQVDLDQNALLFLRHTKTNKNPLLLVYSWHTLKQTDKQQFDKWIKLIS